MTEIAIIVILIILLIVQSEYIRQKHSCEYIKGFWVAPKSFLDKAGLDNAYVYFDDNQVYYFANQDDKIVLNYCVPYKLSCKYFSNIREKTIECVIKNGEEVTPLPKNLNLRLLVNEGFMALFDDEKIHLQLYKNYTGI